MRFHLARLAIDSIRSRRTRSWLTILGVLIGVTAVVALLSIGTGVKEAVLQQFEDIGYDIIVILPGAMGRDVAGAATMPGAGGPPDLPGGTGTTAPSPDTFVPGQGRRAAEGSTGSSFDSSAGRTFSPGQIGVSSSATSSEPTSARAAADVDALLRAVPGLVAGGNLGTRIASVNAAAASGFLRLTTPSQSFLASFPSILDGFAMAQGTTFTGTTRNEVVVGARSARSLDVSVEDTIVIDGTPFTVVGILASSGGPAGEGAEGRGTREAARAVTSSMTGRGASFVTRGMTRTDDSLFILEERASVVWSTQAGNTTTIVRMATGVDVETVITNLSAQLASQGVRGTPVSVQEIAGSIQGTLGMIETVLASIAAVALIVGGVGLMNTMYTSVLERTREIGILKAVGARDGQVMALFLVDSGLMGLIGGILGLVAGGVLSLFGTRLLGPALGVGSFQPVLRATLILGVLAASFAVGALSGAWPAWRAARLSPVDALGTE